jgi:hypothetical protein
LHSNEGDGNSSDDEDNGEDDNNDDLSKATLSSLASSGDKGDGNSSDGNDDNDDDDNNDDDNDDDDDDDDDDLSKATLLSLASSGHSSSSAGSTIYGNYPNRASCNSNPFQPSSNRNAFSCSNDTDVMLLSRTNNSLQQCISSSDSSSLIGLHHNPERNACMKDNSYKVGNDSSEVGNDCFCCSSDESASVDTGDPSIPMPNSFKPSPRSSFEVSNVPLSNGRAMTTGPVVNLHLGSPKRGDVSRRGSTAKRIGTRSSTMAVKTGLPQEEVMPALFPVLSR